MRERKGTETTSGLLPGGTTKGEAALGLGTSASAGGGGSGSSCLRGGSPPAPARKGRWPSRCVRRETTQTEPLLVPGHDVYACGENGRMVSARSQKQRRMRDRRRGMTEFGAPAVSDLRAYPWWRGQVLTRRRSRALNATAGVARLFRTGVTSVTAKWGLPAGRFPGGTVRPSQEAPRSVRGARMGRRKVSRFLPSAVERVRAREAVVLEVAALQAMGR